MTRRYRVSTGVTEHLIEPRDVPAWIRGYLAAHPIAQEAIGPIAVRSGETIPRACVRILTECHNRDILVYLGMEFPERNNGT